MSANVGPNMTPMVDVVMCILIFFMLGSSFLAPELFLQNNVRAVDKGLSNETPEQKLPSLPLNILLRRQGDATYVSAFDSKLLKMDGLNDPDQSSNRQILAYFQEKKKSLSDDVQLIIFPDKQVPYQDVITIYDFCTKARFKQVAFAPAR
jgi:biopolymer transport protein ExbD